MPLSRRAFLAASTGLAVAAAGRAAEPTSRPANVVFLFSDEHNTNFVSVYGHPLVQTPNLERLAREGTIYDAAWCPSPLCMPCRSSIMSGRRVHEIQTYSNCNLYESAHPSYGAILREQGVHSVHVGKTDAYRPGAALGFSEMLLPKDRQQPGDGNGRRRPLAIRSDGAKRADGFGVSDDPFRQDDAVMAEALRWVNERAPGLEQPWVLSVNLIKPHFPHIVTQALWDRYPEGADLPAHGVEAASAQHPYAEDLRRHFQTEQFTEDQIRGLRRGYLGCVDYIDQQVGRMLDALEELGLRDNTLVIYASDHGEMLGKFGMWWKCSLYEDSLRVPLIVSGPGFARGVRDSTPVDLLDVQASFFAATGARRPSDWTGEPLQGLSRNDGDRFAFAEYHGHGVRSGGYAIRQGEWKLLFNMEAEHQLFHLGDDPEELNNRYTSEPAVASRLEDCLRSVCDPEAENERAHAFEEQQFADLAALSAQ